MTGSARTGPSKSTGSVRLARIGWWLTARPTIRRQSWARHTAFLPGREPLAAADFSGGAATVGHLLSSLGFQVTQAVSGLTVGKLVELVSALRLYRSPAGRQVLHQPLALL